LIAVLAACGRSEEQPADSTEAASATAPAPTGPPAPTAAEIGALAARVGVPEPVARALLIATAQLGLSPTERDERLTTLVADLEALEHQLQTDAGDEEADRALSGTATAALRAGDFAAARSAVAAAVARLEADATSSDPARATRLAALRAEEGQIALLQVQDAEAAILFEAALGGVQGHQALLRARYLGLLGLAQLRAGRLDEAHTNLEQSVRLHKAHQGNEHPEVGAAFERLADCYRAEGEYGKAEILYQRALGIWQKEAETRADEISRAKVRIQAVQRLQGEGPAVTSGEST
jgi:tetratricopeptide (TPR) repeat protein